MSRLEHPLVVCGLNLFCRSRWPLVWWFQGHWYWWAGGLRERWRKPVNQTTHFFDEDRVCECRVVWVKDDIVGDLAKDWGGLGGLHNVSVHVGYENWVIRGLRPPPRWRSVSRDLVAKLVYVTASLTLSSGIPAWT